MEKEAAKAEIKRLIEKCNRIKENKELTKYDEERTRNELIDHLFAALGWDVWNKETDEEVVRQERVKSKGSTRRVDYAFKLNGVTKFFVEAKGLKENIEDPDFASQAIGYGWHRSIQYAILTNFEGLKVFNCEWNEQNVWRNQIFGMTFNQYLEDEFDRLWLLSKESFLNGELDKYATKIGKRTPAKSVGEILLTDMSKWRKKLSDDLKHKYKGKFNEEVIEETVQRLLNRLIFIRTCEDRGIEEVQLYNLLKQYKDEGRGLWTKLLTLLHEYDGKYNSRLFEPSTVEEVELDDKVVADIVKSLYYTPDRNLKYDFALIDADILGNMYEQYLSQLSKGTSLEGHRKEQGIFYTPTYVVDYIVKNTIGEWIKEKSAKEVDSIKILDPACGSGSFLIKSFDYLEKVHENRPDYAQIWTAAHTDKNVLTPQDRILKDNLHGVDLDQKAVEIAQLNLLIKAAHIRHRLPTLRGNIQNGNSLIDDPAVAGDKAFKWEEKFSKIMDDDKFDVVIGNPPYVQLSMEEHLDENVKSYLVNTYGSSMGRLNTFGFFISKSIRLVKDGGLIAFIIPNTILTQDYYGGLREEILRNCKIKKIVNFSELPFKDAVVENVIIILQKTEDKNELSKNYVSVVSVGADLLFYEKTKINQNTFENNRKKSFSINVDEKAGLIKNKIERNSTKLGEICDINQAIALKHERSKYLFKEKKGENYKPVIDGRNIGRYTLNWDGDYLKYDLSAIHSCKREDIFLSKEKIFFRRVSASLMATLDEKQIYALNTLVVMNMKNKVEIKLKYVLGLFNSRLIDFYYQSFLKSTKNVFSEIQARQVAQLPINLGTNEQQKDIEHLVEQIIAMNKHLNELSAKQSDKAKELQGEIAKTDKEIDELVYKIYGITEEEKKIIESSFKN